MSDFLRVAGALGSVFVVPWIVFLFGFSVALPFMMISVVKNVARMRRALERIADAHESRASSGGGGILGI